MTKQGLPDGNYIAIGRRFALGGVISVIVAGGSSLAAVLIADAKQTFRIEQLESKVGKLELGSERDRSDIAEIKSDIRVIRTLLEQRDSPPRRRE